MRKQITGSLGWPEMIKSGGELPLPGDELTEGAQWRAISRSRGWSLRARAEKALAIRLDAISCGQDSTFRDSRPAARLRRLRKPAICRPRRIERGAARWPFARVLPKPNQTASFVANDLSSAFLSARDSGSGRGCERNESRVRVACSAICRGSCGCHTLIQ